MPFVADDTPEIILENVRPDLRFVEAGIGILIEITIEDLTVFIPRVDPGTKVEIHFPGLLFG